MLPGGFAVCFHGFVELLKLSFSSPFDGKKCWRCDVSLQCLMPIPSSNYSSKSLVTSCSQASKWVCSSSIHEKWNSVLKLCGQMRIIIAYLYKVIYLLIILIRIIAKSYPVNKSRFWVKKNKGLIKYLLNLFLKQ